MTHLLITVRFLDDRYHGLLDRDGPPEWPPSPYRLFQSLLAGIARQNKLHSDVGRSLKWLETCDPPMILTPRSREGQVITRFVPNNDGDKKPNRQDRLRAKTSRPTIMLDSPEVHYLWPIADKDRPSAEQVCKAARYLTTLGWGIDMAYADAKIISQSEEGEESEIRQLPGIRWYPRLGVWRDVGMLRTPIAESLNDLKRVHRSVLNRIEHGKPLNTVEQPRDFDRVLYESKERLLNRPYVVFDLRNDDGSRFGYPQAKLIHITGMVRHLAIKLMRVLPPEELPERFGDPTAWVRSYVAGHCDNRKETHWQFSYLPLPSIGHAHTDPSVRRVMIAAPLGDDRLLFHMARLLSGQQLIPTARTRLDHPPTLVRVERDKQVVPSYTRPAVEWASVTPVILPGHNDHKPEKTRILIEKALRQSGIEQPCEFEWNALSHFPKSLSAHKYDRDKRPTGYIRPDHLLSQTAVHLRLRFNNGVKMPGPLVIGAGRHCGLGLFAACGEE